MILSPFRTASWSWRLQQQVHLAEDDHQRVVDLVRDAARQLADRGQPLGAHHVGVRAAQVLELPAGLGVETRVVEGQADLVGDALEQGDLLVGERSSVWRPSESVPRIRCRARIGTHTKPRMPSAATAARAASSRSPARRDLVQPARPAAQGDAADQALAHGRSG